MKPPFLTAPQRWTRSLRVDQSPVQYASAFEGHVKPEGRGVSLVWLAITMVFLTSLMAFKLI